MSTTKKLFLLDAMALIYRAYFALSKNPSINSKGQNTSAILGFANTLYDILKNQKPTHIGVAFDTSVPTFRHISFPAYKAQREKMPEDLSASIPYIKKLIKGFNIPILYVDGFEADDVIGTLSKIAEKEGFTTYMMTPDKDFGQLVSENIFMFKPARMGNKAEIWGPYEVCERFGISNPLQVIDILGLWGDASDNIPGVPGIGEKTAIKLVGEYDSIENLLANTDKLKGKQKENVINFSDQALMSKELATIKLDVPIEFNADELKYKEPNVKYLKELFNELEFKRFAKRLFNDMGIGDENTNKPQQSETQGSLFDDEKQLKSITNTKHSYQLIDNIESAKKLASDLLKEKIICFDTETTGIDPNNSELVGISFSVKAHEGWYVPVSENYHDAQEMILQFKSLLESDNIIKVGQNIKFDINILSWYDIHVKGAFFDTMIAHYLLQPDMRHNMDLLSETYLGYKPVSIEELIGKKGRNQLTMRNVNIDKVKEYATEDADVTLQLKSVFEPKLKETGTYELFKKTEMPLVPVLASMEREGIKLDVPALNEFSTHLEKEIKKTEDIIFDYAGIEFNIASPKQLGQILFERLAISSKPKKTKTGQYKTGEDILSKLIYKHPIVEAILEYRSLTKLKSTYVDALPELVNPRDGRIHTSYNQAVAATGRLSSNNPNLQNIPIRTKRGREIRKAFIPRNSDYVLLAADYSQVELRIIAHISKDKGMIKAFNQGYDIHTATAANVYNVGYDEVTKDMRRSAKTVNFGIIYGISAFGLSERLGIPRREAANIINSYFEKYPGIESYMKTTIDFAKKHGYVETILGRRRYLKDINSANAIVRNFAERNAINAPIQGSSADMIKVAMINIHEELINKNFKTKMILQVHDELVFDLHKDEEAEVRKIVNQKMVDAIKLDVPVVVDMNTGDTWLEAH